MRAGGALGPPPSTPCMTPILRVLSLIAALTLSACTTVSPPAAAPTPARPATPATPDAPEAPRPPDPAVIYAPPQIDRSYTSQFQDSRALFIVLHYTAIPWEQSLRALTTTGNVSAHYLVRDNPARIYQLVDENRRAWHAGASSWAGHTNINSSSIGIEIVNLGYTETPAGRVYQPFPQAQMDQVIALVRDLQARHQVKPERIIGHSDIAPGRKPDPGPLFPWKQLADAGLIPWPDPAQVMVKTLEHEVAPRSVAWLQERLAQIGYNVPRTGQMDPATKDVVSVFQMKYRPANFDGQLDAETSALIEVVSTPSGMQLAKAGGNLVR